LGSVSLSGRIYFWEEEAGCPIAEIAKKRPDLPKKRAPTVSRQQKLAPLARDSRQFGITERLRKIPDYFSFFHAPWPILDQIAGGPFNFLARGATLQQ